MPHMMPMYWMLTLIFSLMIIFIMMMMFYFFFYLYLNINKNKTIKTIEKSNLILWNWKW